MSDRRPTIRTTFTAVGIMGARTEREAFETYEAAESFGRDRLEAGHWHTFWIEKRWTVIGRR